MSRTMITGYKKKKLGHPSEKLSGDVPRAKWRNVLFSEIIFPVVMAVIFVIAYMFVNSFPDASTGRIGPSPLLRIAVISLGPVVWNAAVLIVLFLISLFLGPMMASCYPKFGSLVAVVAHACAVVGLLAFFEFMVRFAFPLSLASFYHSQLMAFLCF
jgi:1,3-beta-glucan synthase